MASIPPDLYTKLQHDPNAQVRLIFRLKDTASQYVDNVQAHGLNVRHVYTLINAIAVEGTASAALALSEEPWVMSIEEDKPVHTM